MSEIKMVSTQLSQETFYHEQNKSKLILAGSQDYTFFYEEREHKVKVWCMHDWYALFFNFPVYRITLLWMNQLLCIYNTISLPSIYLAYKM
jgi:hypothetical protein